jgi:hypothetical protein
VGTDRLFRGAKPPYQTGYSKTNAKQKSRFAGFDQNFFEPKILLEIKPGPNGGQRIKVKTQFG